MEGAVVVVRVAAFALGEGFFVEHALFVAEALVVVVVVMMVVSG